MLINSQLASLDGPQSNILNIGDNKLDNDTSNLLGGVTAFVEKPSPNDDRDAAALCQWAYDYYGEKVCYHEYHDWKILTDPSSIFGDKLKMQVNMSGFASLMFTKKVNGQEYFAYCTLGTQMTSWADWFNNLSQGLTGFSPQYTRSVKNAKIINDVAIKRKAIVWFIGHSLGGGMASNNSIITGKYAVTFDAAGLNILRVKMSMLMNIFYKNRQKAFFNYKGRTSKIHAYILKGEILNRVLQFIGQKAYGDYGENNARIIKPDKEHIRALNTFKKHALTNLIDELNIPYNPKIDFFDFEKVSYC